MSLQEIELENKNRIIEALKNTTNAQQKEIERLKTEKDKWFNAFHKLIMKPF
jgi:uncharacterized protein (DUF305 family)